MMKNRRTAVLSIMGLAVLLFTANWAVAQSSHHGPSMASPDGGSKQHGMKCPKGAHMMGGGHGGMMSGGMDGGKMDCGKKCPMKGGGMHAKGMHGNMLMRAFHGWTNRLMAHAGALGLNGEQIEKIDQLVTGHLAKAIRDQADVKARMVLLRKALRADAIDLDSVEKQLQENHATVQRMQMDGVRLYTQLLDMLTPEQRQKVFDTIGRPFPSPWDKGGRGMMDDMDMDEHKMDSDGKEDEPAQADQTS